MEIILELLKITIPAVAVMVTSYFVIKHMLDAQYRRQELELRREISKSITPNKINAYERIVLFLERIHPAELVLRVHRKGMNSQKFQAELVKTVREEFQHNLTQQLYVSNTAWGYIRNSKEETIKLINVASSKVPDNASAIDLSNMIFQIMGKIEQHPVDIAKDYLKQELRKVLR
ncbi:MAG: hypothetical protein CL840_19420 [Crocinitomicaceae bacterium]|nr:hypothetical protein [Crocinitomicaceae bacterium]|tara:strand:- start:19643 stop:20167 length:525 start_codon:yes stop_codon:yes gene_type:complete